MAGYISDVRKAHGLSPDGLFQFDPPFTFTARKAVVLGDALDRSASDPKVAMKVGVERGHASAHQLKRVLADAGCNA